MTAVSTVYSEHFFENLSAQTLIYKTWNNFFPTRTQLVASHAMATVLYYISYLIGRLVAMHKSGLSNHKEWIITFNHGCCLGYKAE